MNCRRFTNYWICHFKFSFTSYSLLAERVRIELLGVHIYMHLLHYNGLKDIEGGRGYPPASASTLQSSRSPAIFYYHLRNAVLGINAKFSVTMNLFYLNHRYH